MMSPESHVPSPELEMNAWWNVLSNFPFLLFVLGNGVYTFTLGVYNTYGPDLFVGLGLFTDETSASLVFGIIVAVGDLIGTPLGGYFLDRLTKDTTVAGKRCFVAMMSLFVYVTIAEVFILSICFLGDTNGAFLACFTFGLLSMCALWASDGGDPQSVPGVSLPTCHLSQRRHYPHLRRRASTDCHGRRLGLMGI